MAGASDLPTTTVAPQEFANRRARALELATASGLDGLVVFSRGGAGAELYGDVAYLADHHTPICQLQDTAHWSGRGYAVVVIADGGQGTLITDNGDWELTPASIEEVRFSVHVPQTVAEVLRERGLSGSRLGLVGRETLLHHTFTRLHGLDDSIEWVPADSILERMRLVKSAAEVEMLRRAALVGVRWMEAIIDSVEPGRTEGECVGEGLRYLATQPAACYDIAVASGPSSQRYGGNGLPSWDVVRPLEAGDLFHVDVWGPVSRYFTDFARSTVVGNEPSPEQFDLLEASIELIDHVVAGAKPGAEVRSLHARGAEWMTESGFADPDSGFADQFPAFGHSLGLGIELPYITADDETVLEPGMAFGIETVLTRPGVGGAGHEEDILVTEGGCEVLTAGSPARTW